MECLFSPEVAFVFYKKFYRCECCMLNEITKFTLNRLDALMTDFNGVSPQLIKEVYAQLGASVVGKISLNRSGRAGSRLETFRRKREYDRVHHESAERLKQCLP